MNAIKALGILAILAAPGLAHADTCWVTAYERLGTDSRNDKLQIGGMRHQTITATSVAATTQLSSALPGWAEFARIICDIQVFFEVGSNPTATISTIYLPADVREYIDVEGGEQIAFCDADCT